MADAVTVLGGGLIGLPTALRLAQAGLEVTLVTDEPLPTTAAAAATGLAGFAFSAPVDRVPGWRAQTVAELESRMDTTESLRYQPGLLAARQAFEPPERISASRGFRPADPEVLPHGFAAGFWVDMIVVDVPRYLAELLEEAAELGVVIEERRVTALSELASVVVNCAGARAGLLAGDESVQSDWGMHVITTNPLGLEHHFMEIPALPPRWVSWMPRGDRLLIGGTSELRSDRAADPELGEALFAQAVAANPALASAEIVGFNAGLRGRREAVRVELETRAEVTVIHNYGHGGLGLTLSWGCADEVLRLLKASRAEGRSHE